MTSHIFLTLSTLISFPKRTCAPRKVGFCFVFNQIMDNLYQGSLLYCLNKDKITHVVLASEKTITIYTADMGYLLTLDLPFKPHYYLPVSKDRILFFDTTNRIASVELIDGVCTEIDAPRGTSEKKMLAYGSVFETEEGFLFFPRDAFIRSTTFIYSFSLEKFKRVNIKIPEGCFSFGVGRHGVLFRQLGEGGDLEVCSFETAYKKREFYPEFTMSKNLFLEYLDVGDVFDLPWKLAYISLEKKAIILVVNNKLDQRFIREIIDRVSHDGDGLAAGLEELAKAPDSGKAVLIRDDGFKKEIPFNEFIVKGDFSPFCDHLVFVEHGRKTGAYSTDDLTLLASSNSQFRPGSFFLPDGRMVYEVKDGVCVTDSSPFSALFKTECAE